MGLFLIFEVSQPNGTTYRLGLGWLFHPNWPRWSLWSYGCS